MSFETHANRVSQMLSRTVVGLDDCIVRFIDCVVTKSDSKTLFDSLRRVTVQLTTLWRFAVGKQEE